MPDEYLALQRNRTWSLVPLPPRKKSIGYKWVFKVKENPDGTIHKYKARLVLRDSIKLYFDFNESFSPIIKPTTIRITLKYCNYKRLEYKTIRYQGFIPKW